MYKAVNKKVTFERKQYEIFWVTDYVQHIVKRFTHNSHRINIIEIEKLALNAHYVHYKKKDNLMAGIGRFNGKLYRVLVYFVKSSKRCVIKTCSITSDNYLLQISKKYKL